MTAIVRLAPGDTRRNGLPEPRGYVYNGSGEDTLTAFMDRKPRPPKPKRGPGRPPEPCGTAAAYRAHKRRGETPCEPCRQARIAYERAWRKTRRAAA